ncbi:glycosyltransferase family 2 protein [Arenibaculum pallidiluteum]|uniref:glycosyltransferase family 2 protein n=1 Tax=Arenibaculum pallidiluteum TaxID=2812559 RepID=UPI001A979137|nr:glycosyltransferase family A protein [Arenibaculum pallidiluteum]
MYAGSIIIPLHDQAPWVAAALDSVEAAIRFHNGRAGLPRGRFRVVVVDDASGDGGADAVRGWAAAPREDLELVLLSNARNLGASATRNRGVAASMGELLWFLDADDAYLPCHLAVGAAVLERNADVGAVRSGVVVEGRSVHPGWLPAIAATIPNTLCVRRACHDLVGGWPEHDCFRRAGGEDGAFDAMLCRAFTIARTDAPTALYRWRSGSSLDRQAAKLQAPPEERQRFMTEELAGPRGPDLAEGMRVTAALVQEVAGICAANPHFRPPTNPGPEPYGFAFDVPPEWLE